MFSVGNLGEGFACDQELEAFDFSTVLVPETRRIQAVRTLRLREELIPGYKLTRPGDITSEISTTRPVDVEISDIGNKSWRWRHQIYQG